MSFDNSRIVVLGVATIGAAANNLRPVTNIPTGTTHFMFEGPRTASHLHINVNGIRTPVAPGIPYGFGNKSSQVTFTIPTGTDEVTGITCCQLAPY
jgi:hypothetical protein